MEFSREELCKIIECSLTLTERIEDNFLLKTIPESEYMTTSRLEKWCQRAARGEQNQFEKRLLWDGLNLSDARRVLAPICLVDTTSFPAWVKTLNAGAKAYEKVYTEILKNEFTLEDRCLNSKEPVPFEELLLPFIYIARQKLIAQTGSNYHLILEVAHAMLERSFLSSLAGICQSALELKFSDFRTSRQSTLAYLMRQFQNIPTSREQYQTFILEMLAGGFRSFFLEYPVLARLVAVVTDLWVDATKEFIQRLASNLAEIQQTFQAEAKLGQVVALKSALSDPHHDRRSVIAVTFDSGLKLVYKPRDLGLEEVYSNLLSWFNQHGISLKFKLLKVLNYSTYGWVEFVESLPCKDQQEVQRYYQRTGMLLCVLYLLKANDCHHENLIASAEYPVLVDMETLMHHQVRETEDLEKYAKAPQIANQLLYEDSVLRSNLLPQWLFGPDKKVTFDLSGLGGDTEQETAYRVAKLHNINTDDMRLCYEFVKMLPKANLPRLDHITQSPNNYVEEIVDGFQQMYHFLVTHQEALLSSDSPLTALTHQQVRFVFRPTRVYASILNSTLQPKYLRDGIERSMQIDTLSRALLSSDAQSPFWSLLRAERQALEQMDVPHFTAYSDSDSLTVSPTRQLEQCFQAAPYQRVIDCLRQLSHHDLSQQVSIIRTSLYSRVARKSISTLLSENLCEKVLNLDAVAPLTQEQLVQQAVMIANQLQLRAIRADDSSATWIGLEYLPQAERLQLQPLGWGLCDGSCGVALFLAALANVTGNQEFRDLGLEALLPVRRVLQNTSSTKIQQMLAKQIGIGAGMGIGSILYALVRISQFLGEPTLLQDAKQVASWLQPEWINTDENLDIVLGAAGTILGLLALYEVTTDPTVLEQAIACGSHLLSCQTTSKTDHRAWLTLNGKFLTGFSHGAAGIAYALLRLYETTQIPTFLAAAREALDYERSVFSPAAENWPDLRNEKNSFMTSWCHGAPGIGLARLGGLSVLDNFEVRQEIEFALKTTQKSSLLRVDRLCCGNFGLIEVLLVASRQLSSPKLLETAQKRAAWVVNRAEQTGSFHLFPNSPKDIFNPSLFMGTAGIGYELLRLGYPNKLPSLLLWH